MVILCVGYFPVAGTPDTEEVRDEKTEVRIWMIRGHPNISLFFISKLL